MEDGAGEAVHIGERRGAGLPWLLFAATLGVALLSLPARTYGDDLFFVWCIVRDRVFTQHFLYMPIARPWTAAWASMGVDPLLALRLLAATGTAAGVAFTAAAARRRGASSLMSIALALVVFTASSTWFFGRAAEIHGLQLGAFGLCAWILAGMRVEASPRRMLAVALAFGLLCGVHKTSALLLPAVIVAYVLATRGRAQRARVADIGWFSLGGLISLGAMAMTLRLATGSFLSAQEGTDYWSTGIAANRRNFLPEALAEYAAEAWIAPTFAFALFAALLAGALLRSRPRAVLALVAIALPYAVVLPLFGWAERGAYLIVCLPVVAFAAVWSLGVRRDGRDATARRALVFATAAACAGAVLTLGELEVVLGVRGMVGAVALAFVLGTVTAPRFRQTDDLEAARRSPGVACAVLTIAIAQAIGSARTLAAFDAERPILDWGRDTVEVTGRADGERDVLVCTGFERYMLLLILSQPWREPYAGTWEYADELASLSPLPFDVGFVAPQLEAGVPRFLDEGKRIFVLDTVFRFFEDDYHRGAAVRALREDYDLVPIRHGRFEGAELLRRAE